MRNTAPPEQTSRSHPHRAAHYAPRSSTATAAKEGGALASYWDRANGPIQRSILTLGVIAPVITFLWNLTGTPDYTDDEVLYTVIGQHIIGSNSISAPLGPLIVHPPVFFALAGLWQWLLGKTNAPILDALDATRVLNAFLCILIVWFVGLIVAEFRGPHGRFSTPVLAGTAMLLASSSGLFLRFGRTVLIEPLAVLAGLVILRSWRWARNGPTQRVVLLGVVIGISCLVKQTVVFVAVVPLLSSIICRDREQFKRALGAGVVSVVVWWAFPLWAAFSKLGSYFANQQITSVKRLLGLLQVTGINKGGDSASTLFIQTLPQYASSYALIVFGGIGLCSLALRTNFLWRMRSDDDNVGTLIAYGLVLYAFVGYSFLFGQGNEQLTMYAFPVASMMCVLPATWVAKRTFGSRTQLVPIALAIAIALGLNGWLVNYVQTSDDGTRLMADYISANIDACTQINATGDSDRWQAAITDQQVTGYPDGPMALQNHVHYFLYSPKDSRNSYGNSSPALGKWIQDNGTLIHTEASVTYEELQLWLVGRDEGAPARSDCANTLPPPKDDASALRFVAILIGICVLLLVLAGAPKRRRPGSHRALDDRDQPALNLASEAQDAGETTDEAIDEPTDDGAQTEHQSPARGGLLALGTVGAGLLNYVYALGMTHFLDRSQYAVFAAGQGLILIEGVIGSAGVAWVLAHAIGRSRISGDSPGAAVNFTFWVNIWAGVLFGVLLGSAALSFAPLTDAAVVASTAFMLAASSTGLGFLQGYGLTERLAAVAIAEVVIKCVVGFAFVAFGLGSVGALAGNLVGAVVPFITLPLYIRHVGRPQVRLGDKDLWASAGRISGLQGTVGLVSTVDVISVAASPAASGGAAAYQAAATIGKIPLYLSTAISTAVFPSLGGPDHRRAYAASITSYLTVALFCLAALVTVPDRLVRQVFNTTFADTTNWLGISAVLGLLIGLFNLLMTRDQAYELGLRQVLNRVGAAVGIAVVTFVGAHAWGMGGMLSTLITSLAVTLVAVGTRSWQREGLLDGANSLVRSVRLPLLVVAALTLALVPWPLLWLVMAAGWGILVLMMAFPELAPEQLRRRLKLG